MLPALLRQPFFLRNPVYGAFSAPLALVVALAWLARRDSGRPAFTALVSRPLCRADRSGSSRDRSRAHDLRDASGRLGVSHSLRGALRHRGGARHPGDGAGGRDDRHLSRAGLSPLHDGAEESVRRRALPARNPGRGGGGPDDPPPPRAAAGRAARDEPRVPGVWKRGLTGAGFSTGFSRTSRGTTCRCGRSGEARRLRCATPPREFSWCLVRAGRTDDSRKMYSRMTLGCLGLLPLLLSAVLVFLLVARLCSRFRLPPRRFLPFFLSAVSFATLAVALTETLSALSALTRQGLSNAWWASACVLALLNLLLSRMSPRSPAGPIVRELPSRVASALRRVVPNDRFSSLLVAALLCLFLLTFVVAIVYPPNNYDSMVYHVARVMHWAQQGSVAHYPTATFMQLQGTPLAEFFSSTSISSRAVTPCSILRNGVPLSSLSSRRTRLLNCCSLEVA